MRMQGSAEEGRRRGQGGLTASEGEGF